MALSCVVPGCSSKYGEQSIRFHRLPLRNPKLLMKWKSAVNLEHVKCSATHSVCSKHFLASDYEMLPGDDMLKLHDHAAPSVNLPKKANQLGGLDKVKATPARKTIIISSSSQSMASKSSASSGGLHVSAVDNVNISPISNSSLGKGNAANTELTPQRRSVRRALKNQPKESNERSIVSDVVAVSSQQSASPPQNVVQLVQQPSADGQQVIYVLINSTLPQPSQTVTTAVTTSPAIQIPQSVMDVSASDVSDMVHKQHSYSRTSSLPQSALCENSMLQQLLQREKVLKGRITSGKRHLKSAQQLLRRRERRITTLWKTCQSLYENSDAVSFVRVLNPELNRNRTKPTVSEIKPSVLARLGVVTIY